MGSPAERTIVFLGPFLCWVGFVAANPHSLTISETYEALPACGFYKYGEEGAFGGNNNEDYRILGFLLGSPYLWRLPHKSVFAGFCWLTYTKECGVVVFGAYTLK